MTSSTGLRFVIIVALFVATGCLLFARRAERIPRSELLSRFPLHIGDRTSQDVPIPADVLEVLGPGDFLERIYFNGWSPAVDLYLAYFPSQRTGDTIHSPRNCLPGGGWTPVESGQIRIALPSRPVLPVNRYVITKAADRRLVLYWYQAHGRAVASEYQAKFYLIADAIRMNRTDGSLVRIVTRIAEGEDSSAAQARAVAFAQQIIPELDRFIPR
jgi:EpsI family protein